jgi:hypothetical protein
MGAIADAIVAYAQPLIDDTDGSMDEVEEAFAVGQICWNLAVTPEEEREEAIVALRPSLELDDLEFEAFRRSIVEPMLRRHREMFPQMHEAHSRAP